MFLRPRWCVKLRESISTKRSLGTIHFPKPFFFFFYSSTSSRASDLEIFSYSEDESNHHRGSETMKPKRQKYNDRDVKEDRLSNLPDFLLLHILSFMDTKRAVQTCILSTRWKNIWNHLPSLTLYYPSRFSNYKNFTKFVSRILSLREASASLHSLDFRRRIGIAEPRILKRIVKYAISHNVRRLRMDISCHFQHFPTCIFSCRTLTSLDLYFDHLYERLLFPNSLDLPALTSLSLNSFTFCVGDDGRVDPFSALNSLTSLIIQRCSVRDRDAHNLCISSATLVNLTLGTESGDYCKVELSTPSLCTFLFRCTGSVPALCESNNNLSSVKHVNINVTSMAKGTKVPLALLSWLVELANIKSLIITSYTLEVLSWVPELLKFEFHSLCNLKLLKLKTKTDMPLPLSIPNGTLYFLLQNSPSAKVEIIR